MYKPIVTFIIAMIIGIMPSVSYAGESESYEIPMTPDLPDVADRPDRKPPMRFTCIIDLDGGVTIQGIDSANIISYMIYTETGETVGIFADEQSFLSCLRGCTGTLRIVLRTPSASYSGLLSL